MLLGKSNFYKLLLMLENCAFFNVFVSFLLHVIDEMCKYVNKLYVGL